MTSLLSRQVFRRHKNLFLTLSALLILVFIFFGDKTIPLDTIDSAPLLDTTEHQAIVLPHHDLIIKEFPNFYEAILNKEKINKIILLSPNHFEPDVSVAKIKKNNFWLLGKELQVDTNIFSDLTGVVTDDVVFDKEHGVFIHLPFINQYFENVSVTPILFTRNITKPILDKIILRISETANANTLIIVSTDFSHGLVYGEAEKRDQETARLIQQNQAEAVLSLNDEYLDCPACMYIFLRLREHSLIPLKQIFHGNSHEYLPLGSDELTTSYFVLFSISNKRE